MTKQHIKNLEKKIKNRFQNKIKKMKNAQFWMTACRYLEALKVMQN